MGEAADEIAEEPVSGETKRPEAYDADKDLVGCHPETRVEYEIAEAGIGEREHGRTLAPQGERQTSFDF